MDQSHFPLGFRFALTQNPEAMRRFSSLPEERQWEIVQSARRVSSRDEMKSLVDRLL